VTIKDSRAFEPHSRIEAGQRYNFNVGPFSSQILFTNVTASGGRRDFVSNGTSVASGIVFHKSRSISTLNSSEGHQRWSQALLFDSILFENPQHYNVLSLHNRGDFGSSHGWGAVHSTAWNVEAGNQYIFIQKPPGGQNYGIGNRGNVSGEGLFTQPEGYIEGTGFIPFPPSLYDTQLAERLENGLPPDMPLDFNLSDSREGAITIRWKQLPPNNTSIIIERSEDGTLFSEIARVSAEDQIYEDQNVMEKEYTYRIRAHRDGQHSAYTYPKSEIPQFTEESLTDFDLLSPMPSSEFVIEGEPENNVVFQWDEVDSILEISYSWVLMSANDSNQVLAIKDSISTTDLAITYGEIQEILQNNGVDEGELIDADWTIFANTETVRKQARSKNRIQFLLASVFDTDLLNGGEIYLEQNYPNPFNPYTNIRYHLAEDTEVSLSVYNISGVKVADIDRGLKERGTHTVTFTPGSFASGIYFYKLIAGNDVQIRKMLLIK
jgi:hypothetical protein